MFFEETCRGSSPIHAQQDWNWSLGGDTTEALTDFVRYLAVMRAVSPHLPPGREPPNDPRGGNETKGKGEKLG